MGYHCTNDKLLSVKHGWAKSKCEVPTVAIAVLAKNRTDSSDSIINKSTGSRKTVLHSNTFLITIRIFLWPNLYKIFGAIMVVA